jgi:hypothetical protein
MLLTSHQQLFLFWLGSRYKYYALVGLDWI